MVSDMRNVRFYLHMRCMTSGPWSLFLRLLGARVGKIYYYSVHCGVHTAGCLYMTTLTYFFK